MKKAKANQKDIAFVIETVAHLNSNPAIQPYVKHLLLAAEVVRGCTDEQFRQAFERLRQPVETELLKDNGCEPIPPR